MISKLTLAAIFFATGAAYADMFKVATLDLKCTADGYPQVRVYSSPHGAALHIGDQMFSLSGPMIAATEGSDPAVQVVDNNYFNVIISGADLTTAFQNNSTIEDAEADIRVQLFGKLEPLSY
ncbi:MAG: hypothetical protein AB7P49_12995, partial [Bdellovibrionales bacterium]